MTFTELTLTPRAKLAPNPPMYDEAALSAICLYLHGDEEKLEDWHVALADALAARELGRRKIDWARAYARRCPTKV